MKEFRTTEVRTSAVSPSGELKFFTNSWNPIRTRRHMIPSPVSRIYFCHCGNRRPIVEHLNRKWKCTSHTRTCTLLLVLSPVTSSDQNSCVWHKHLGRSTETDLLEPPGNISVELVRLLFMVFVNRCCDETCYPVLWWDSLLGVVMRFVPWCYEPVMMMLLKMSMRYSWCSGNRSSDCLTLPERSVHPVRDRKLKRGRRLWAAVASVELLQTPKSFRSSAAASVSNALLVNQVTNCQEGSRGKDQTCI